MTVPDTSGEVDSLPRLDRQLAVSAARALPDEISKDYLSTLRALPVMLHTSGLAATCAYLLSRAGSNGSGGGDKARYLNAVQAVLRDAAEFVGVPSLERPPLRLLDDLVANDATYRMAERRARQFAVWLARLAAARHAATEPA